MFSLAALLLSLSFSSLQVASSGPDYLPFGVAQRQQLSALGCQAVTGATQSATGQYARAAMPTASPLLEDYILAYVQGVGICNVVCVSAYGMDDVEGTEVRRLSLRAKEEMIKNPGKPDEEVDLARSASAAREERFRLSIIAGTRQVFAQWNALGTRFPNMQSASVVISGDKGLGLAIYEVYRFAGNDECLHGMEVVTGMTVDE
jgi:hypothetical protein